MIFSVFLSITRLLISKLLLTDYLKSSVSLEGGIGSGVMINVFGVEKSMYSGQSNGEQESYGAAKQNSERLGSTGFYVIYSIFKLNF